jgi:hypothetical protein
MNELGDKMNKKWILTLSLICMAMVLFIPLGHAGGPSDIITVWTDQPTYSAGQTGRLYITYNNIRDSPVTIRNISVVFKEWWAYDKAKGLWLGNMTYMPPDAEKTITEHATRVYELSFTVPSDGRAINTDVEIKVYTNLPTPDKPIGTPPKIYVVETPVYMEQIATLFTIQVVLIIVCTIIIAATIFLSVRRPQVTWRTEEKAQ